MHFYEQAELCNITGRKCETGDVNCICTYEITIPYDETIQFVLTSPQAHPIHLHGHTFHVVDIGYPTYDPDTGFVSEHNRYTNRVHDDYTVYYPQRHGYNSSRRLGGHKLFIGQSRLLVYALPH